MSNQNRHPSGVPTGGQFAAGNRSRASIEVGEVPGDGLDGLPELPPTEDILAADSEQLWDYVRHEDPAVRVDAAGSLNLTAEQCAELADPERQPSAVREAVARLPYPGVASRAVKDPSPVVRWLAAQGGWDLSPEERAAVESDPAVARVRAVMAGRVNPSRP